MPTPSFIKTILAVSLLAATGFAQAEFNPLNLTTQDLFGPSGPGPTENGTINEGFYSRDFRQPTGTGYIDPFVRVGMQGSAGKDVVEAYNTTVNGVLNNSNEDNWNHEVRFGEIAIQGDATSGQYLRFMLDINQNQGGTGEILNLDDVQIFVSSIPNQGGLDFPTYIGADGLLQLNGSTALVYRMDDVGMNTPSVCTTTRVRGKDVESCTTPTDNNKVTLDYSLNSGSGSGDMYLDIGLDKFTDAIAAAGLTQETAYVYLYSKFGSDPYVNNDGFEEWSFLAKVAPPPPPPDGGGVPEPGSLALAAVALLGVGAARRRQRG